MNELVRRLPDDDEPKTWKDLAEASIMDFRRYADDETPERRYVSVEAYEERFRLLAEIEAASFIEHSAKEVGAVSDAARLLREAAKYYDSDYGYDRAKECIAAADRLEASRTPVVAEADEWPWKVNALREALVQAGCTTYEGRRVEASMEDVLAALTTPSSPDVELQELREIAGDATAWSVLAAEHLARAEAAEARASSAVKALEEIVVEAKNAAAYWNGPPAPSFNEIARIARTTLQSIRGEELGRSTLTGGQDE